MTAGTARPAIQPLYAIAGSEGLLRHDALGHVIGRWPGEVNAAGIRRIDGNTAGLADVLDEVRTPSLFGDRCLVVVDDADAFIKDNRKALERYCADPADSGTLILMCNSFPATTKLYKVIAAKGEVIICQAPKGRGIAAWITARATQKYGKRMDARGAALLRAHAGDSLGLLDTELAKLAAYLGARDRITPADIEALTGQTREEKVFGITDAMASGDTSQALRLWEQVLATDRAAPGRAIGGLAWAVGRLLDARRDWERGVSLQELSRRLFADPQDAQRRLDGVTVKQLELQRRDLLAIDLAVKTGASTLAVGIEKFIVKHSAVSGTEACGT